MITKLCTLDGVSRRKDRSITLRLTTAIEQTSEDLKVLDLMYQQHILVALKPESSPFMDAEIEALDSVDVDLEDKSKTPSKRLRAVLYRLWEQTENDVDFKDFYKTRMEQLISMIKNKLE